MSRNTENYFVVYLLPVGCSLFSGVKLSMKWLLLPDLDLALGLHFGQSFVLKTNVGMYEMVIITRSRSSSRLTFWAVIRFENKCRDRTIGWLIFIDFLIVTLSVSVKIPLSALKAIFSGLPQS